MADLVGTIYRMSGSPRANSLVVPYDDENRMREVLRKIRNAPDFEDIYQRRIGTLVREAYPKGPKRNQAVKALGEYYEFSRALKEVAPELALSLDHVVPFQFLKEVEQGKNPMNLIKVKPIPTAINIFKSNFDAARIDINRALQINPTDKNALNKFKVLKELEQITPLEFGGVSTKGNVYDFKAKPIGQSNLIEDAIEGLRTYNRIGKFSKQVLTDEALQKKLIESGVVAKKDFGAFKRIKPLSKAVEDKVINTIVSYSKLKKCQISLNAEGGRIGFANSVECITDGLNEAKKAAGAGDKKAARQLLKTAEVASRGKLLKNLLGPGAILGEAVYEGAVIGNKVLGGKPADIAYAESYLSYLDPRKYRGELDPLKMAREDMLTREVEDADGNIKTINAPGFSALKSGFEAQDQLSAFNKAIEDRDDAKTASRIDLYNPAAADAREQGARADQSANIISSDCKNGPKEFLENGKAGFLFNNNQEKELERLRDGVDQMSTAMAYWDSEDNLVYANKIMRAFQRDYGFAMKPGTNRLDMLNNSFKKGGLSLGNESAEDYHKKFIQMMDSSDEAVTREIESEWKGEKNFMLNSAQRLSSGDYITTTTNITEQKTRELSLKRLTDAIDTMQTGIIVWDKDHKLLFANESSKQLQKEIGFIFKPGVSRHDMLKNQAEKNASPVPEGTSIDQWIEDSMKLMRENPEGLQGELSVNEKMFLYSVKLLDDGSYIQSYANITELRKKEKDYMNMLAQGRKQKLNREK